MLLNLNKQTWMDSLNLDTFAHHCQKNEQSMQQIVKLAKLYKKSLLDEEKMTPEQLAIKNVGKQDPKRHLAETVNEMLSDNIVQNLASMLDTTSFK